MKRCGAPTLTSLESVSLEMVDLKNASWNRIASWLGRIEALRAAA